MNNYPILNGIDSLKKIPNSLKEDPIILRFNEETRKALKENLAYEILFGSRARMDNQKYSDYDFLILIHENKEDVRDIIEEIGVDILNKYNILISCLIWSLDDWELKSKFPIGMNILREGILL
ncbi:MAG: nucleotidyltransferase domain-containing protein [Leptospiraceae bacterium]|nr:nucleotidyltransferase domain-containing protein [Leptospiraceae bacterium]